MTGQPDDPEGTRPAQGAQARRRGRRNILDSGMSLGGWVVIAASVGICAAIYLAQRNASADEAAFWSLRGPPCPTLDAASYQRAWGTAQVTRYDGASFEYRVGHMMCTRRPGEQGTGGPYPVCQFTGPVFLGVETGGHRAYFAPPSRSAARVAILNGQAHCVLIPRFKMNAHL
jgi:hypothetical protein